jgi:hypothetical protein
MVDDEERSARMLQCVHIGKNGIAPYESDARPSISDFSPSRPS